MAFSTRTMMPDDWTALAVEFGKPYFKPSEFKRPHLMGYEFMHWLFRVRVRADVSMHVISSARTPAENAATGGAADSAHVDPYRNPPLPCDCVDIGMRPRPDDPNWNYSRFQIQEAAMALGCKRIGEYDSGSLHLDRTEDRRPAPRKWRVVGDEPATPRGALPQPGVPA